MAALEVETGIPGLDSLLGGGLERNRVSLVSGEIKTGKTIFGLQFINRGLEKGENAVYATTSGKPADLLTLAERMGWNLRKSIESNKLIIMDLSPYTSISGKPALNAKGLLAQMSIPLKRTGAKRLVIDSIDSLLDYSEGAYADDLAYLQEFVSLLETNQNFTTLIISNTPTNMKQLSIPSILEHIVKRTIVLSSDENKNQKWLAIRKVDEIGVSLTKKPYRIEDNAGIRLESLSFDYDRSLKIGQKIPDFKIDAYQLAKPVTLNSAEYRGKWLVVVFYPGDFTFICPTELEALADNYAKFRDLGAEVLTISMDSVASHRAWHDSSPKIQKIMYPMGSDPSGEVCDLFHLYNEGNPIVRATFIFDPDGILKVMEMNEDRIGRNVQEILRKLSAARYERTHPDEMCPEGWKPGDPAIKT
jgi:peroxiredoxin (alkyl hydroperoxide reductase subunit C)